MGLAAAGDPCDSGAGHVGRPRRSSAGIRWLAGRSTWLPSDGIKIVHTSSSAAGRSTSLYDTFSFPLGLSGSGAGVPVVEQPGGGLWRRRVRHTNHHTIMICFVAVRLWKWPLWVTVPVLGSLLSIDALFLASNSMKLGEGGWFALAIAIASFTTLMTWKRGRALLLQAIAS